MNEQWRAVKPDDQQNAGADELLATMRHQASGGRFDNERTTKLVKTDNGAGVTSAGGESGLPHHSLFATMTSGIQLVHNIRALLPVWWCDDCGAFRWISCAVRTPFRGRLVTELLCRPCHAAALLRDAARTSP